MCVCVYVYVCVYVRVCVCVRERERETDRQTNRQTEEVNRYTLCYVLQASPAWKDLHHTTHAHTQRT